MRMFITREELEARHPEGDWSGHDVERVIRNVNLYLGRYRFKPWQEQPEDVTQAAVELVFYEQSTRLLFSHPKDGVVKRRRTTAGPVTTETEYAEPRQPWRSAALNEVEALLEPWLAKKPAATLLNRM